VLNALVDETATNTSFTDATATITNNMRSRAEGFAAKQYPYGSEFAFDTTGQEAVVVWLLHFANASNTFAAAAKRTVDHVLSYMRSSPT